MAKLAEAAEQTVDEFEEVKVDPDDFVVIPPIESFAVEAEADIPAPVLPLPTSPNEEHGGLSAAGFFAIVIFLAILFYIFQKFYSLLNRQPG